MSNLFVPYEQALELKELGFNVPCFATYDEDKNFELQDFFQTYDTFPFHIVAAPIFFQAFKFFREKYEMFVSYQGDFRNNYFDIVKHGVVLECIEEKKYEDGELRCLKQMIKIVKDGRTI